MKKFLMLGIMLMMSLVSFSQSTTAAVYQDNLIFMSSEGVKTAVGVRPYGNAGIGVATPDSSAILDLTSTTMGLGLPQMTTTQVNAIASPRTGLTVYNTTLNLIVFYNGSGWLKVTTSSM
ncbi:MAG: hypothetical protein NXI00_10870 [Cytophagales bacterium]|nr:hypothetical protein [Cytophagales bacterium]